MNILVLGGTVFLGRAIVEAALARQHQVTLFNRGRSNPDLFPQAEHLHGDRDGDLRVLAGRRWDAVIDTAGYVPRVVRRSAELLRDSVDHYTFISSISVYADLSTPLITETAAVGTLDDPTTEQIDGATYGPLKALCEQTVHDIYGDAALIIRPGLIVGPHDSTDRFTYWPWRIAQGGEVLAPQPATTPVQIIDVRDLAAWIVRMVETKQSGVYNATASGTTLSDVLHTCHDVSASDATFTWLDAQFLLDHNVQPWRDLPLWLPPSMPETNGMMQIDTSRAVAAGLTCRSLADTVQATLDWANTRSADHVWTAGLSREREAELLAQWHHSIL